MTVAQLSALSLPAGGSLRRDPPPDCVIRNAEQFWANYDSTTLIYDCVRNGGTSELRLYMPKAYNLKATLQDATFLIEGQALGRGKWKPSRHLDMLVFPHAPTGDTLHCQIAGQTTSITINTRDTALTGCNVLYTMSRNNALPWIKDWAAYHQKMHGANAVVICDNGSDQYSPEDILDTLSDVPDLKEIRVVTAPLPFGPRAGDCTKWSNAKFLQAAMMNLCKDRFMGQARAILNLDVDELVASPTNENIFDATAASLFGHITFPGTWHHATAPNPRHADHIFVKPQEPPCPSKYTLRPTSFLARFPMQVHSLSKINRKLFMQPKRFHFLHCRNISTSWKVDRSPDRDQSLTLDHGAQQVLENAFGKKTP